MDTLNIGFFAIGEIKKKFQDTGSGSNKCRSGRAPKTTEKDAKVLRRIIKEAKNIRRHPPLLKFIYFTRKYAYQNCDL